MPYDSNYIGFQDTSENLFYYYFQFVLFKAAILTNWNCAVFMRGESTFLFIP